MEAATLKTVFQPFEHVDQSIAQRFGGLGLGLAIAKASVDAHGGRIHAVSAGLGRGETFAVTSPMGLAPSEYQVSERTACQRPIAQIRAAGVVYVPIRKPTPMARIALATRLDERSPIVRQFVAVVEGAAGPDGSVARC